MFHCVVICFFTHKTQNFAFISLKGTEWGELDVLILDLPPGTGDVQLTLCQDLQLNGAISVTTPSKLAIADAVKGIEMFNSLGVPTLATVENMAFFQVSLVFFLKSSLWIFHESNFF